MLKVDGLTCGYGSQPVLDDVSFEVPRGATLTLLGPNGVGKSTLLKTVMGVLPAMAGRVLLDGEDITSAPAHTRARAGIAWVPEGRRLFAPLSVRDNLMAAARGTAADTRQRLDLVVGLFPRVAEFMNRPSWQLSGGEQQMVAVGRALMSGPRVLLLDEPSLGLAPIVVRSLLDALTRLCESTDITVVLVEQNVRAGLSIADSAVILERGGIGASGKPNDLLASDRILQSYLSESA